MMHLCRLDHYNLPAKIEVVYKWLITILELKGTPSDIQDKYVINLVLS